MSKGCKPDNLYAVACWQHGLSSVCDFQELYRYLIDDFIIQYCSEMNRKDLIVKSEDFSTKRKGKREYLRDSRIHDLVAALSQHFQSAVKIPRIRMGNVQKIETLINEEAYRLAMFLRRERQEWSHRSPAI